MPRTTKVLIKLSVPLMVAAMLFIAPAQARIVENVHYDHAPVLQVIPVSQTVQATHTHEYCAPRPVVATTRPISLPLAAKPQPSSFLEHLRALFASVTATSIDTAASKPPPRPNISTVQRCQQIEAGTHYQRIVAWDVDYIYQGKKYRSRMPLDPGNCVRLRVSITPLLEAEISSNTLPE